MWGLTRTSATDVDAIEAGTSRADAVELLARALCIIGEVATIAMGKAEGDHISKLWTSLICTTRREVNLRARFARLGGGFAWCGRRGGGLHRGTVSMGVDQCSRLAHVRKQRGERIQRKAHSNLPPPPFRRVCEGCWSGYSATPPPFLDMMRCLWRCADHFQTREYNTIKKIRA
jgi:hypothetical protein